MRVHRLEIEAFGAFVEKQVVDVDTLSAQHLFLLHGETGAGKTTVLDALCFGLYGEVPGARNGAGHLRSDHAEPHVEPRVTVEVTVRGRRFRLSRSPKWLRPKKRGSGTTLENASVTLQEIVDGERVHLSSRIDETNQLMIDLIGLTPQQFCQVVLLPQGSFATFLRAKSDERRTLLQKIFSTRRFADIETWLVERRKEAARESERHHEAVRALLARLTEAADTSWPELWPANDVAHPAAAGDLAEYADELVEATRRVTDRAVRVRDSAAIKTTSLREQHTSAVHLAGQAVRARRARTALEDLERRADELADAERRCESARRAQPVVAARSHAARAAESAAGAARMAAEARVASLAPLRIHGAADDGDVEAGPDNRGHVEAARDRALHRRSEASALVLVEEEAGEAESRAEHARRLCASLSAELARMDDELAQLPQQRQAVAAVIETLRPTVAAMPQLAVDATAARTRLTAALEVVALRQEIAAAESRVLSLREAAADRRDELHACRERRFAGMASEIAMSLAVGADCPVCGSCDHPAPASHAGVAETRAAEEAAQKAYEDASFDQQVVEEGLAVLRSRQADAQRASAGLDEATARAEHDAAAGLLAEAETAARELVTQESLLAEIDAHLRDADSQAAAKREALSASTGTLREIEGHAGTARERLTQAMTGFERMVPADVPGAPRASAGAAAWARWFSSHSTSLAAYADALLQLATAELQRADAETRLSEALEQSGFDDTESAADAHLDGAEIDRLSAQLQQADRQRHTAESTLAEMPGEIDEVLSGRRLLPDVADLAARLAASEKEHDAAHASAEAALRRRTRVEQLAGSLRSDVAAWTPLRERHAIIAQLAATAEGKGADNPLQMRLSAYVLASRLSQVVAAANDRLASMAEQRYELEHTAFKGVGDRRGGLSLQVVDAWTGESRDPATLSGGETFVVALALALGLADVVTAEAGGAEIETLFVDEGFGSLDPHTLDRVMDCLDDLRSGGRSVGVVSHVAELRDRIPDQLHIIKTPNGSQVQMALASGASSS